VNDWSQLFLGIIALATLLMALMQIGAVVVLARVAAQVRDVTSTLQQDIRPLLVRAASIADEAQRTAVLATAQAQKIDRLVTDLTQRVDETSAVIQQAIITPAREGIALFSALKATLMALRGPRDFRSRHGAVDEEDALFIGSSPNRSVLVDFGSRHPEEDPMVRMLAVLFAVFVAAPIAVRAQDSKSSELAKQLGQLLDDKKLDAIAAADPRSAGTYAAALYYPGTELLVVSAKYAAPALLDDKLAKKDYRDVYVDLSSASVAGSKVFVMDMLADGLFAKPKGDTPADSIERRAGTVSFDGDPKKAKMSDSDYAKAFEEADTAYAHMLQLLIDKLKSGT
jgi:hypothetical protein